MAEEKTKAINQAYKLLMTNNEQITTPQRPSNQRKSEDVLFNQAVKIATEMGRLSASVLQRRLSIGYSRAAKILNMMEQQGLISPPEGSKPRKVLQAAYDYVNDNLV